MAQSRWRLRTGTQSTTALSRDLGEQRDCLIHDKKVAFPPCKLGCEVDRQSQPKLSGQSRFRHQKAGTLKLDPDGTRYFMSMVAGDLSQKAQEAKTTLDAHVREIVEWHFNPETGCSFWLDFAAKLGWDPRREIRSFEDLKRFPPFEDEWLRGGPLQRWLPKGLAGKPLFVFETGGTTGIPKSRLAIEDFRIDYEMFSQTLPDEYFPKGANWLMLGPSGPRRLRLAVEHLCQHRG